VRIVAQYIWIVHRLLQGQRRPYLVGSGPATDTWPPVCWGIVWQTLRLKLRDPELHVTLSLEAGKDD
jgi:hypothetical protein